MYEKMVLCTLCVYAVYNSTELNYFECSHNKFSLNTFIKSICVYLYINCLCFAATES